MRTFKEEFTKEELESWEVKVQTETNHCWEKFANIAEAKKKYPTLDIYNSTEDFTSAMRDGEKTLSFEDWVVYEALSK